VISPNGHRDVFSTILARRSVRSFKKEKVSVDIIRNLLEAAVRAPTAVHQEPWGFAIIQDEQTLKSLSDIAKPLFLAEVKQRKLDSTEHLLNVFESPDFSLFYNAGVLIIICGKTSSPFFVADCWLAAENLMLAACAMDLGTCVIGSAVEAFNNPEVKRRLGISDDFTVVAPIVLGYPEASSPPTTRKSPLIFTSLPLIKLS